MAIEDQVAVVLALHHFTLALVVIGHRRPSEQADPLDDYAGIIKERPHRRCRGLALLQCGRYREMDGHP